MPTANVKSVRDNEPDASSNNINHKNNSTINSNTTLYGKSTSMDTPSTLNTTHKRKDNVLTENDKEEYELKSLDDKKQIYEEGNAPLSKKDQGNFVLLVVLCKFSLTFFYYK